MSQVIDLIPEAARPFISFTQKRQYNPAGLRSTLSERDPLLSFECLWTYPTKPVLQEQEWRIEFALQLVSVLSASTWPQVNIHIQGLEISFLVPRDSPTFEFSWPPAATGVFAPLCFAEVPTCAKNWGFQKEARSDMDMLWLAQSFSLRFFHGESAHVWNDRLLENRPLLDAFRSVGFQVDGPVQAIFS
jgi:hypothetical protein